MKINHWVAFSLRFYRQLLRLYPQAYRAIYEMEMLRVFKNQCREAYQQQGRLGILLLWSRTLIDLAVTVVREHLSDPQVKVGLLDAMPNAPLPWKGVVLVLIPGLIFFASQVIQLTSSKDWYFLAFYRAGYFLILPVLLVWLLSRRFPVWGLIPLGLLYGTLASYNPTYVFIKLGLYTPSDSSALFPKSPGYLIAVSTCIVLLCGLIWYHASQRQISRSALKWIGFYGLLILLQIAGEIYRFFLLGPYQGWTPLDVQTFLLQMPFWFLYDSLPFLLLIFIGMLLARKHGGLTFLLLLGYLLPRVIFGRYDTTQNLVPFYIVSLAVLLYRFVVALIAPVWLVRAASIPGRQCAAAIPVAIAILCHISLSVIVTLAWASHYSMDMQTSMLELASTISKQLIIAAGLGLAVALYLPWEKDQAVISPPTLAVTLE